jgi:membrane protein required for beta-lactamase induction
VNLIALLLGLFLEHRLTRLFSLREARWFDAWFDLFLGTMSHRHRWLVLLLALPAVLVPVVPVFWVCILWRDSLLGLPYVGFSILMLLLSLGPRNLQEDVEDYVSALRGGRDAEAARLAKTLAEHDLPGDGTRADALVQAVCVQANNRLFGVIFWFVLLGLFGVGPAGAWLFRMSDLLRRRATFEAERRAAQGRGDGGAVLVGIDILHGALAWVPGRVLALGYALAGSWDRAISDWRDYLRESSRHWFDATDEVLACVGLGALGPAPQEGVGESGGGAPAPAGLPAEREARRVEQAMAMVNRTLWIWLTGIAVMTLAGSVR